MAARTRGETLPRLMPPLTHQQRERLFTANQKLAFAALARWSRQNSGFIAWYRLERDDLEAVALLALWNATERYQPRRGQFSTLAMISVHNALCLSLKAQRAAKRGGASGEGQTVSLDAAAPGSEARTLLDTLTAPDTDAPHVAALRRAGYAALWEALDALTPHQRETVCLCLGDDLTVTEAAAKLGISRQCVNQRLRRGCDKLRAACRHLAPE